MNNDKLGAAVLLSALALVHADAARATSPPAAGDVTLKRLMRTETEPGQWLTAGGNWRQTYYSALSAIDKNNVAQLGFAWAHDIAASASFQSTPLVVDGVLYASGTHGDVYALDAINGTLLWSFKPQIEPQRFVFRVNRGVAVWRGKVFVESADCYLYALSAATGAVAWKADTLTDRSRPYWNTGAPYIAKDLVVVGNGGSEFGTRGYVTAYDTRTGKQAWRFFLVPGDPKQGFEHPEMQMAAKTWDPNSQWRGGVGGNAWDAMNYDPELNLLYVGTGNGAPWTRELRSPSGGDNLFLSSILAINPDTGRLVWYYQTTPGDNWDWGATQKTILADLTIGGRQRKVLMQAPKNGFFYVLDRATGELLAADPIVYTNWATHVDMKTGRPVETGKGDYSKAPKLVFPMDGGGHNWHPMSFSPRTGLVYVPVGEAGALYAMPPGKFVYTIGKPNFGAYYRFGREWEDGKIPKCWPSLQALQANEPDPRHREFLRAWDPVRRKVVWEVPTQGRGGVISTASDLLLQGHGDGHFSAFDAITGSKLLDLDIGGSMMAAPLTYMVDGEQYVAIMAGSSKDTDDGVVGRVVALKLGGRKVPAPTRVAVAASLAASEPPPIADTAALEEVSRGARLFESNCSLCHASGVRAPDLAQMTLQDHREFLDIVLKGSRASKGMSSFGAVLGESEARAIQAYAIRMAWERYRRRQGEAGTQVKKTSAPTPVFASSGEDDYCAETQQTSQPSN